MIPQNINEDEGRKEIDELYDRIETELSKQYEKAAAEMQGKLREYLKKYDEEDEAMRERLDQGQITETEFVEWRKRKILNTQRWVQMRDILARDATNTDAIALSIIKGHLPSAYAIGHNYGTYMIESTLGIDTSYTLYNRQAVERLIRDNPKLLPDPSPNGKTAKLLREHKDLVWNRDHIQGQVVQGILQGEPLTKVAARMQTVTDMDNNAAKRNAATMLTSAQNGGRLDSFKRAENMGIQLKKVWIATLDGRTRDTHRHLDGQEQDTDKPFKSDLGDIMFPGDPTAAPANVYNCRCAIITQIKGFERDVTDLGLRNNKAIEGQSYDEWKNEHRAVDKSADNGIIKGRSGGNTTESKSRQRAHRVGKINTNDENEVISALERFESKYRSRPNEYALVIARNGYVYFARGDDGTVNTTELLGEEIMRGSWNTHNHPPGKGAYTFSKEDIVSFADDGTYCMRATDSIFTYELIRADKMPSKRRLVLGYENCINDRWNIIEELGLGMDDVYYDEEHVAVEKMAKMFGLRYRRWKNG